jgi:fructose-bisphosphate aldolase, class I
MLDQGLIIEGTLLKPNMVTAGAANAEQGSAEQIAWLTVRTLSRSIVPALPGVVFLSGGQSEESASLNLNAMNALQNIQKPWALTFSFGRALQQSVLKAWMGKVENVGAAQAALLERAQANGNAAKGCYTGGSGDTASTYVANYTY